MKFRIYTYKGTTRVLHTAYTSQNADAKYSELVNSGEYDTVEMWLSGFKPLKSWKK